jgi:hypothetical protein
MYHTNNNVDWCLLQTIVTDSSPCTLNFFWHVRLICLIAPLIPYYSSFVVFLLTISILWCKLFSFSLYLCYQTPRSTSDFDVGMWWLWQHPYISPLLGLFLLPSLSSLFLIVLSSFLLILVAYINVCSMCNRCDWWCEEAE